MSASAHDFHNLHRYHNRPQPVDPEDSELAFLLQNAAAVDHDLLQRIFHKYSPSLYTWAGVLLFYRNLALPTHTEILVTLRAVIEKLSMQVEQLSEFASLRNWLFSVSLRAIDGARCKGWLSALPEILSRHDDTPISNGSGAHDLERIDRLPARLRLPLILRYLFDLELSDIADILHIQISEVHHRLNSARKQLCSIPTDSHPDQQVSACLDGLLDEGQADYQLMVQHLEACASCQAFAQLLYGLEQDLSTRFKDRWQVPSLRDDDVNTLVAAWIIERPLKRVSWETRLPASKSIWFLGFSLVFILMAVLFIRITPEGGEFPLATATPSPTLPPLIEMQTNNLLLSGRGIAPRPSRFIVPGFSSDGMWAVFASLQPDLSTYMSTPPTIELYSRSTNSVQVISESTAVVDFPWSFWRIVPGISGDGQWIAFTSIIDDTSVAGKPCDNFALPCTDIFIYNREDGQIRRITHSTDGGPANANSFLPSVSADGQWVAFWSSATNLVDDNLGACGEVPEAQCFYVYLYHRIGGTIEKIPIGNALEDEWGVIDRISLSADARIVAFTVRDDLTGRTEAIIFDHDTGEYELMPRFMEGLVADSDSFSPVLSADGRYVAFSSFYSRLQPGWGSFTGTSWFANVFILDRESGKVDLISRAPNGLPSDGDSGIIGRSGYLSSLDMSPDGRYIVFNSEATNLSDTYPVECDPTGLVCNFLYFYDRQTGRIELINDPPHFVFSFFPKVSSDGRWISFMQFTTDCPFYKMQCSDVMLYDRQQSWLTNVTKSTQGYFLLPWSNAGKLATSQQLTKRNALVFSSDGSWLALAGENSPVRLWHLPVGLYPYRILASDVTLSAPGIESYTSLAFSPDGRWLVAGTDTRKVVIWSVSGGKRLYTLEISSGPVKDAKFTPDGERLILAGVTGTETWLIGDKQLIRIDNFTFDSQSIFDIAVSPLGNLIATARSDGSVWLHFIPGGNVVGRLGGGNFAVRDMAFSSDGSLLATLSMDRVINIWQIISLDDRGITIKPVNTFKTDNLYTPLAFSPDNRYLASSLFTGSLFLWGVYDGNIYGLQSPGLVGPFDNLAFSDEGSKLVGTGARGDITLWSTSPGASSAFFVRAMRDAYGDSGPQPSSTLNDILLLREPSSQPRYEHLALDQVASRLDFPLLVPAHLPSNMTFKEGRINMDGSTWLEYEVSGGEGVQAGFYIYEQDIGGSPPPTMTIGASAAVVQVPVFSSSGLYIADYVQGDWSWSRYYNSYDTSHIDSWVWFGTRPTQRLRWQQQDIFIAFYYQVNSPHERVQLLPMKNQFVPLDELLTLEDLLQIAQGMLPYSILDTLH